MSLSHKVDALADYYESESKTDVPVSDLRSLLVVEAQTAALFAEITAKREDQLRQLLSYCRSAEAGNANGDLEAAGASTAFGDVATKLAAILDGES